MLKWLKDALVRHLVEEVRRNAERYAIIISELQALNRSLKTLERKVNVMSSNIDRIEKEAQDAAENVELVRTALDALNTTVTDLKGVIEDLKAQLTQGQLDQARLDAAAAALEKADDDLDALVMPPAPQS